MARGDLDERGWGGNTVNLKRATTKCIGPKSALARFPRARAPVAPRARACVRAMSTRVLCRAAVPTVALAAARPGGVSRRRVTASHKHHVVVGVAKATADDDATEDSHDDGDTIVAIATPVVPNAGGVSVIRVSGPNALNAVRRVFRPASKAIRDGLLHNGDSFQTHLALYGTIRDERDAVLDEVLVLPMLAPRSYTTEDVVEIHCHGGTVCVQRVLGLILRNGESSNGADITFAKNEGETRDDDDDDDDDDDKLKLQESQKSKPSVTHPVNTNTAVRLARPGEFTLRAFLNGRLDLTQAEAVHALVTARTDSAADGALSALRGGLALPVKKCRAVVIDLLAELEARLDFDDELEALDETEIGRKVVSLKKEIETILATSNVGKLRATGISIAIVGRPNAGKSSLLNYWSSSERAIVSDVAGTTRDIVEASVEIGGMPVTLLDTAGIRADTFGDEVEKIGVRRSVAAAAGADCVVLVIDTQQGWREEDTRVWESVCGGGRDGKQDDDDKKDDGALDEFENARARLYKVRGGLEGLLANQSGEMGTSAGTRGTSATRDEGGSKIPLILALNKVDEVRDDDTESLAKRVSVPDFVLASCQAVVRTSAVSKVGVDTLESAIIDAVGAGQITPEGNQWCANQRQAGALRTALAALARLESTIDLNLPVDFWTIDLREVATALGEITGETVAEDVLDVVFTKFCIGK